MSKVLLVGGDSFLAKQLVPELTKSGHDVTCTTRKANNTQSNFTFLDLLDQSTFPEQKFDVAILLAGVWDYKECSENPNAPVINIANMAKLAKKLCQQGAFVSYISSNTVFGGNKPWCDEYALHEPLFPYASHKSLGEKEILNKLSEIEKDDQLNIIRLTKIIGPNTPPLPDWFSAVSNAQSITPFEDLLFAPISLQYAAKHVAQIACSKKSGAFHLSGKENINYYQFASLLLDKLDVDAPPLKPTTSIACGVKIPFLPKYSGLGMKNTTTAFGILPQDINGVIDDLFKLKREQ